MLIDECTQIYRERHTQTRLKNSHKKKTFIQPFKVVLGEAIAVSLTVDAFLMNFIHFDVLHNQRLALKYVNSDKFLIERRLKWVSVCLYFKWTTLFESNRNVKVCQRERN